MSIKEFLAMVLLFTMIFIGLACMTSTVHGADVNIQRDFDNVTIYHAEKSDSSSQAVYGLENNAKLIGRDKVNHTEPVSTMKNTVVESDTGYYTYSHLIDEDGNQLNPTDRVKFNYNRTLTAIYGFTPYMNAEIDVIDLHGHSASSVTYPAMKYETDSVTKTFKDFTDVETGYSPLYILDLDTNVKYQPGDKFTITYNDVLSTGLTKIIINEPIIPISNNNNTDQYNETNPINYQNNNTTNLNNITSNINKENNIGTSTSDNLKTVTMKRTGTDNPIGLIIVIILFGILILIYRRED